jgi:hypothetical protein
VVDYVPSLTSVVFWGAVHKLENRHYAKVTSWNTLEAMPGFKPLATSDKVTQLNGALLTNYVESFYGFGNWEPNSGSSALRRQADGRQRDIERSLQTWDRNGKAELEDAPTFYPALGNARWHGASAALPPTWAQLLRMFLAARGMPNTNEAILD